MVKIGKLKQIFNKILSLDAHPGHISTGFAVGVFISCTPFFGLHTILAIAVAFIYVSSPKPLWPPRSLGLFYVQSTMKGGES
jgi:hypothetical protein